MQAAKYWRNKKLRYRLVMMARHGKTREDAAAKGRSHLERESPPGDKRVKALA